MNTNSLVFKEQVRQYIIESLSTDETEVLEEQLQNVVEGFLDWYTPYERKMTPNRAEAFKSFLFGMPSVIDIEVYNNLIRDLLDKWFEQIPSKRYKVYSDDEVVNRFYHLIHREFTALCKKNGVDFPY